MSAIQNEVIDSLASGVAISATMKLLFGGGKLGAVFSQSTLMEGGKIAVSQLIYRMAIRPAVSQVVPLPKA